VVGRVRRCGSPGAQNRQNGHEAANDDQRSPNEKSVLKETFAKANLPAEIEVYDGAAHGWCPPDSGVYNEPQAEKAWSRLLAMYGKALA
jgi:carboxymethylenebutenolidase